MPRARNDESSGKLNPACLRVPDELVQLKLQTGVQAGFQHPLRQFLRLNRRSVAVWRQAEDRTEQQREPAVQVVSSDRLQRPIEVLLRSNNEFDLVGVLKEIEVRPAIAGRFAA